MRRYRFRLQPVLSVRRNEEDVARGAVFAARSAAAGEQHRLAACEAALSAALTAPAGARTAAAFRQEQSHRNALASAVLLQRRRLTQAEQDVTQARSALASASARVSALERLDERQRTEHGLQALREQDQVVDDLVVARFGRSER